MRQTKSELTKHVVLEYIQACGPVEFSYIVREVREQAYLGYLARSLDVLKTERLIVFDPESETYVSA